MAKKTPAQRMMSRLGLFPFAPVRLLQQGARLNAASSILLGKDLENGFTGGISLSPALAKTGDRFDLPKYWADPSYNLANKVSGTAYAWMWHLVGSFTPLGLKRAVLPVVATEIAYVAAKGIKANKLVPPEFRKFVRVY